MKFGLRIHHKTVRIVMAVAALAFFVTTIKLVDVALASSDDTPVPPAANERLISIHDRGQEMTILTSASTVRDALRAANIAVDAVHDVVEPSLDTALVSTRYSINIYRARPVVIHDGARRVRLMTAQQTPELIAAAASMSLRTEDKAELRGPEDLLRDGADIVMMIQRAQPVRLQLFGSSSEVWTRATTVAELLQEKQITLNAGDTVSVPLDTPITPTLQIAIWREGKQTITTEEVITMPVEKIQDANQPAGYHHVKQAGAPGKKRVTYEVEMQRGKELSRREIAQVVVSEPVVQIEIVGIKGRAMPYTGGGNKDQWLAAAGIPRDQWGYADWLVKKESGWNPNAVNRSSGACGLAQALPCSKVGADPYNPVVSLRWMHGYVLRRYGSWEAAVAHSKARGWY
ncbi:MAG: ubiquitin-like domain-containing protein [Candidatus Saccharibacteria bacterium]|nr:ubiquitin-like domain-containing protein [Candidatus Saccharibacteria bacterium]